MGTRPGASAIWRPTPGVDAGHSRLGKTALWAGAQDTRFDQWSDPRGESLGAVSTSPVYQLLGQMNYFPAAQRCSICSMALAKSPGVRMTMVFPFTFAVASEMLSGKLGPLRK